MDWTGDEGEYLVNSQQKKAKFGKFWKNIFKTKSQPNLNISGPVFSNASQEPSYLTKSPVTARKINFVDSPPLSAPIQRYPDHYVSSKTPEVDIPKRSTSLNRNIKQNATYTSNQDIPTSDPVYNISRQGSHPLLARLDREQHQYTTFPSPTFIQTTTASSQSPRDTPTSPHSSLQRYRNTHAPPIDSHMLSPAVSTLSISGPRPSKLKMKLFHKQYVYILMFIVTADTPTINDVFAKIRSKIGPGPDFKLKFDPVSIEVSAAASTSTLSGSIISPSTAGGSGADWKVFERLRELETDEEWTECLGQLSLGGQVAKINIWCFDVDL
ncbi:hypothetical protein HK096_009375 [Nowakowskiella sp. JEL0078]|nr:hypothetical protein HK096_009375 [Nowakowskiella sp. JEL0078]